MTRARAIKALERRLAFMEQKISDLYYSGNALQHALAEASALKKVLTDVKTYWASNPEPTRPQ